VRGAIADLMDAAVEAGELAPPGAAAGGTATGATLDTARLAQAVQTTYNGALITWAILRRGRLETWLRRELDTLLAPYRAP